jgi:hypothetical protein
MRWPAQRFILEVDSAWDDGRLAREIDVDRRVDPGRPRARAQNDPEAVDHAAV